mmetsp:Transcript_9633/g.14226  ORF Transcript_9633/g.14226 Transcript_9633/m.14226 type:complete len:384 (-) Transcript_9633:104-1255(-)
MIGIEVLKKQSGDIRRILKENNMVEQKYQMKIGKETLTMPIRVEEEENQHIKKIIEETKNKLNIIKEIEYIKEFPVKREEEKEKHTLYIVIQRNFEGKLKKQYKGQEEIKEEFDDDEETRKWIDQKEIIGNILILPPREEEKDREQKIAKRLIKVINKEKEKIKSVVKMEGNHEGKYRLQKYNVLYGDEKPLYVENYKESGITIQFHLEEVFFSNKLAGERARITKKIKEQDKVIVGFAGCGPFPCVIGKKTTQKISVVEMNPSAIKHLKNNLKNNSIEYNIYEGDWMTSADMIKDTFDQIVLPAPFVETPQIIQFINYALENYATTNTTIYYYDHVNESEVQSKFQKEIQKKLVKKTNFVEAICCGSMSPRFARVCYEFKVC